MDGLRKCKGCGEVKPLTNFHKNRKGSESRKYKCKTCTNAEAKEWARNHPENVKASQRKRRAADAERFREKERAYYQKTKERRLELKKLERFRRYGITYDAFFELLGGQDFACSICQETFEEADPRNVHIDHCHDSSRVRGILCRNCNIGIGHLKESPDLLRRAADYLSD